MPKNKLLPNLILLAVLLPLLTVGGLFAGAWLFASWLHLKAAPALSTLPHYWSVAERLNEQARFALQISSAAAVAVVLIPLAMVLVGLFMKPKRELHGSARFANAAEIRMSGLLKKKFDRKGYPDLLIGQYAGQYLRWASNEFLYLAAPSRSGKGVGIVIPNCLHYRGSMVVYDPKQENFQITAGFRAKHGQQVFLFNPGGRMPEHERNPNAPLQSHRWNPFTYIRRDSKYTYKDLSNMAAILLPKPAKDTGSATFFVESARKLFVGLALYMIETEHERDVSDYRQRTTLTHLFRLTSPTDGQPLTDWIKTEIELRNQPGCTPLSSQCQTLLLGFANGNAKTGADILASLTAPLGIFLDPVVEAATSDDDFRLDEVRQKLMTIYIGIVPTETDTFSRLTNLFFSQLIDVNVQQGLPENNPGLFPHQCLLLMDEFTALGVIPAVQHGVSYVAGYGLRLMIIIQAPSQVQALYGRENMKTFFTNFNCRIFFTPREQEDAEEYSKIIGYETFKATSRSRGKGGTGQSISDQKRAVMNPDEVKMMPISACVINLGGRRPIMADKIVYHEDPVLKNRAHLTLPYVPVLEVKTPVRTMGVAAKAETVPEERLAQTRLEDCSNTGDLTQSIVRALVRPDDPPEYLAAMKEIIANNWKIDSLPLIAAALKAPA